MSNYGSIVNYDESESEGTDSGERNQAVKEEPVEVIAHQESRDVVRLRLTVLMVLVGSAVAVGAFTYHYVSQSENEKFKDRFKGDSAKILEAIGSSLDRTFGALDGVAVALVSHATYANQTWPFVTLPNFAVRMSKVLPLSDAFMATVLPVVTPENREEWEAYTVANDGWVNEGTAVQATWDSWYGETIFNGVKNEFIHGDFAALPANTSRLMAPIWQNFPVMANTTYTYNYDWLGFNPDPLMVCLERHQAVIGKTTMLPKPGDEDTEARIEAWGDVYRLFIGPDEETKEPVTDLLYPIINEIDRVKVAGAENYNPTEHESVGAIAALVYWRSLIRNTLPEGSNGIQIVFTSCEPSFTYEINGPNTKYLGVGDHHDPKYNFMATHHSLYDLSGISNGKTKYSGAKIDSLFCPIALHLYPSATMQADFLSNDPIIFAVSVLLIFAFASLVFFSYDSKVERRQKTVMNTAVRSTAIVSSLFPATVRDQIYEENEADQKKSLSAGSSDQQEHKDQPIANLYEATTIMFADMVGFTAWSSKREPVQVFELLETLYKAFDTIAVRRKVFKVETIGDCYVAVAGLPNPQEDHAIIMTKFADNCMTKMAQLIAELAHVLGHDTALLAMRVGLHSGSVTGGVLRGQKSRFQLFGDTMNTASRMESTGQPHRIHISQETANELTAKGKSSWVTPREDRVVAKGKGELQTYWATVRPEH